MVVIQDPRELLNRMFMAAIDAAQPKHCIPPYLPQAPRGRLIVVGAGKASAAMARVVEQNWLGPLGGLVIVPHGHAVPCECVEVVEAAHPVPDVAGLYATRRIMAMLSGLTRDDTVLFLISGGGSSLLVHPLTGMSFEDKQFINQQLLRSGASIGEMNQVRRHLSAVKGGRLAAACHPAKVISLLISDVPGDDPCVIASGPTVADASTCEDALNVIRRYGISLPPNVLEILGSGQGESVKPGDPRLAGQETHLVTTPQISLEAAVVVAEQAGIPAYILSDSIEGESVDVGKMMAAMTRQIVLRDQPFSRPCLLLSGGETTVTVQGRGQGGRNVEFLLSLCIALGGLDNVYALAGDTDGVDGAMEIAGACMGPDTLGRAWALGMRPNEFLFNNDAHRFFSQLGDSIVTGPTLTNVNDFRAILIL